VDDPPPPILNYRSAPAGGPPKLSWLRRINRGEDSFLACSALFFATMGWLATILGMAYGAGALSCLNILLMGISFFLCLIALIESKTSKKFPLVGLLMNMAFGILIIFRAGLL
jgi:hypothetical protein